MIDIMDRLKYFWDLKTAYNTAIKMRCIDDHIEQVAKYVPQHLVEAGIINSLDELPKLWKKCEIR